jgi:hypothetical protein
MNMTLNTSQCLQVDSSTYNFATNITQRVHNRKIAVELVEKF